MNSRNDFAPSPGAPGLLPEITWVEPTYHAIHTMLTHPAYAGAYVYAAGGCPAMNGRC
jgi:hypothetical protein